MNNDMNKDNHDSKRKTSYLWLVKSPLGNTVGLTEYTYSKHVIGDHPNEEVRRLVFDLVPQIVQKPTYIYRDQTHSTRYKYTSQILLPEVGHLQHLVVVVEGASDPNHVVTWIPKTNGKGEKITGEVIYSLYDNSGGIIHGSFTDKE